MIRLGGRFEGLYADRDKALSFIMAVMESFSDSGNFSEIGNIHHSYITDMPQTPEAEVQERGHVFFRVSIGFEIGFATNETY